MKRLEVHLEARPELREKLAEARGDWDRTPDRRDGSSVDVLAAWSKLEQRIQEFEANRERHPQKGPMGRRSRPSEGHLRTSGGTERPLRRLFPGLAGALALIVAAAIAVVVSSNSESRVISTEKGERISVELADGSTLHLNAATRITLLNVSGRGPREVRIEGEAFFDVARDESRPFLVHSSDGSMRVVGTSFNVGAYEDETGVSVAVAEGAVALLVQGPLEADAEEDVILRPRQLGIMQDHRLVSHELDVDLSTRVAWREGRLIFDHASFEEVVRRLERWYDLDVDASSLDSVDYLNAVFDQASADEVVSDIAFALGLQYDQEKNRVRLYKAKPSTAPSSR